MLVPTGLNAFWLPANRFQTVFLGEHHNERTFTKPIHPLQVDLVLVQNFRKKSHSSCSSPRETNFVCRSSRQMIGGELFAKEDELVLINSRHEPIRLKKCILFVPVVHMVHSIFP